MSTRAEDNKDNLDERREESPYKCNFCDRAFEDRAAFETHQFAKHPNKQTI